MSISEILRGWLVAPVLAALEDLETKMDNITTTLNEVAEGLRGPLATSITDLIAERDALAVRNSELEGTEVEQGTAADAVRTAFADVASKFAPVAEVPDVEPLPEG